jgi:predicted secreted protein
VDPKLKQKFITTTWVSALLFAPFWIAVQFHWISLDMLRHFP